MKVIRIILLISVILSSGALRAQSPVVKFDINMSGRPELETNDPNYLPWIPNNAASASFSANGITFTFTKAGNNGSTLRADWYKAGVQAPYYARLVCDGMRVDGGDAGAQIQLTISGLRTGTHSLMTFHNGLSSQACSPLDVLVNGNLVVNDLPVPLRATSTVDAAVSYITFNATAGQNVVITFRAETSSSAPVKNVYICGVELNTPNFLHQARDPYPADGDAHEVDPGTVTLRWTKATNAVSHRVYFGTSESAVAAAGTGSPEYQGSQSAASYIASGLGSRQMYYWRIDEVTSGGAVTKGNVWKFRPRQLAFPGAEGYGRYAIGGRGGKVVYVTNLNDSGPGSLREAVTNDIGPRTIVFNVSGIITLQSRLVLSNPFVTIAGQTAPGKGICIRSAPFGFTGNDVIVRHLRLRLGAGPTYDGMGQTGANHSILDHCSISWTIDEAYSSRGGKNITLQRTLISEALNAAGHANYPAGTEHGYAATIGGDVGSFHHNLLAHCYGRNWSLGGGLDGNAYFAGRLDITNNVVYNWGSRATDGGAHELNFVNNYYKPGAGTTLFYALTIDHEGTGLGTQRAYFAGNVMPGHFNESNQTAGRRARYFNGAQNTYETFVSKPFFPSNVTTQSAANAYKSVLSDVGASQPGLDNHDIRMINETFNGTCSVTGSVTKKKGFPDHQNDAGGYESYPNTSRPADWDTDKDGLPDFWERMIGTSPNSPAGNFSDSNADPDGDGYTNLEDYLNWMAEPRYFVSYGGSQAINLKDMFRGFGSSASFSVDNVENGTVSISGNTATFRAKDCGFASFTLKAAESGFTMSRPVGVFVESATPGQCSLKKYDCAGVENGSAMLDDCGLCAGGNTGRVACTGAIQGEDFCDAIGIEESKNGGFIGEAYINFDNELNSSGVWNILADRDMTVSIGVRYANGGTTARGMNLLVNGTVQAAITGASTGDWTTWRGEYVTLSLLRGVNRLELRSLSSDGGPNIDLFSYSTAGLTFAGCEEDCQGVVGGAAFTDECGVCVGGTTGKAACIQDCAGQWGGTAYKDDCGVCVGGETGFEVCSGGLEAEEACDVLGIMLEDRNEGFSGAGYVNTDNVKDAFASWVLRSSSDGVYTLSFRFANGGGDLSRDARVLINGEDKGILLFPPTTTWTDWAFATILLDLPSGIHELRLEAVTDGGLANLDILYFSEGVSDGGCTITGISGTIPDQHISVYPNPTAGNIYWETEREWELLNVSGLSLAKGFGIGADLSQYPEGMYFIRMEGQFLKVIKK